MGENLQLSKVVVGVLDVVVGAGYVVGGLDGWVNALGVVVVVVLII